MTQNAMKYDASRCAGCQSCVAACMQRAKISALEVLALREPLSECANIAGENVISADLPVRISMDDVVTEAGVVRVMTRQGCIHCSQGYCASVCPTGALNRDEVTGLIEVIDNRCIGCHMCSYVCPINAPAFDAEKGQIRLCDGCVNLVQENGTPRCVLACPMGALAFGERDTLIEQADARVATLQEQGFEEACVVGSTADVQAHVITVLKYGLEGTTLAGMLNNSSGLQVGAIQAAGPVLAMAGVAATAFAVKELKNEEAAYQAQQDNSVETETIVEDADATHADAAAEDAESAVMEDAESAAAKDAEGIVTEDVDGAHIEDAALQDVEADEESSAAGDEEACEDGWQPIAYNDAAVRPFRHMWSYDVLDEEPGEDYEYADSDTGELYDLETFWRMLEEHEDVCAEAPAEPAEESTEVCAEAPAEKSDEACEGELAEAPAEESSSLEEAPKEEDNS